MTLDDWRYRVSRQVDTMVRKYGYRETNGQRLANRPETPLVVYRGASLETWRGPYWTPRREIAEGYAALAARAGWDGRVFTTTVEPQAVIHQVNAVELFIHPDALAEPNVEISDTIPPLPEDPELRAALAPRRPKADPATVFRCPACGVSVDGTPCWCCARTPTATSFGRPRNRVLSLLAQHIEARRGTVDVQSVAAQLGTETWTLAMHLAMRGVTRAHITASDANRNRLEAFRAGRYLRSEVAINQFRGDLPSGWVDRFFTPDGPNHLVVSEELRSLVTIADTAHVPEDLPRHADVLMLRHVWRDLADDERRDLIARILRTVPPDGVICAHGLDIPLRWVRPPFLFRPARRALPEQNPVRPRPQFRDAYKRPEGSEEEALKKWHASERAMLKRLRKRFDDPDESGRLIPRRPSAALTLYRGATPDTVKGIHWTTIRGVAEYYAKRCRDGGWDGRLYSATVPPHGIIQEAPYLSNGEHHVDPAVLDSVTVTELPLSSDPTPLS